MRDLDLSAESLFQLKELSSKLEPLCLATQGMGGQDYTAVSVAGPLLNKLLTKALATSDIVTPVVYDFKKAAADDHQLPDQKDCTICR